jgi:transcriptional regulator with XRE-family HTH domain
LEVDGMAVHRIPDGIGTEIAKWRRRRGLSQQQLAKRSGWSLTTIKHVETGARAATPAFIGGCAAALKATPAELQGQPYRGDTPADDRIHEAIGPLRAEVALWGIPPEDDHPPADLDGLRVRVAAASELAHQVQMIHLGAVIPDLLADLRAAAYHHTGTAQREIYALAAETWGNARMIAYRLGYPDLATATAERYSDAAAKSGDPYGAAIGDSLRAAELVTVSRGRAARALLADARRRIGEPHEQDPPHAWTAWGWTHLQSALAAARGNQDADAVDDHLAEAQRAAEHVPERDDAYRMTFNIANARVWGVGLAVELGDGGRAIERADALHGFAGLTPNRVSHHHIDLARARLYVGDRDGALRELHEARHQSPIQTWYHPGVHETADRLARLDKRRTDSLSQFVAWLDKPLR